MQICPTTMWLITGSLLFCMVYFTLLHIHSFSGCAEDTFIMK